MSKLRLSAESSIFYRQIKAKKYLHSAVSAHDSSASDQESNVSGDSEPKDDFNGFSPQVTRTNTQSKIQSMSISGQENAAELNNPEDGKLQPKHSFKRKPATRRTAAAEKKNQEPASLSKITDKKTKPPATKRGKKEAGNPTDNAAEPAAKRPRVASKRKAILTEEAATASTEVVDDDPTLHENKGRSRGRPRKAILTEEAATASTEDADDDPTLHENKGRGRPRGRSERDVSAEFGPGTSSSSPSKSLDDQSRMEAKKPEAVNDEAHEMILKTAEKLKDSTLRDNKGRGRGRGRPERDLSAECIPGISSSSPTKSIDDQSRVQVKTPEAHAMVLKTAEKPKERNYHFLSSSESEIEDEEDDEDDLFLLSRYSFQKTKSPKNAVPLPSFKTPNTVTNKVSELGSPKTSKFRLLPEPTPLLRTTPRRTTLARELSLNRVEPSLSDPEDVADTELYKTSQQENQLEPSTSQANGKSIEETPVSKRRSLSDSSKKPSSTKRLQSPLKSSQQPNDPENDIVGNDSRLIARKIEALQETMLRIENSMNRQVPLNSAIDPSTLPVPNRNLLRTQFNLYLASPSDPVRAQGLSNTEYSISLVYVQPTIVHALKINNPMMVVRLKGSIEFRSDPHAPSHILLNSSTRLVDLEAGRTLHVVNTGEEVASFALLEIF